MYWWLYARFVRDHYELPKTLDRILLVNSAHLGDVVISTAILREIKSRFPECQIDFVAGEWAKPILNAHPGIHQSYFISHWQANRSDDHLPDKKKHYVNQKNEFLMTVEKNTYDAIFFLNSYEPSFISVFRQFKCPLIGFDTAGGGPLLSLKSSKTSLDLHEVQYQASLLQNWLGPAKNAQHYRAWLKPVANSYAINESFNLPAAYVVLHPGSGNPAKEWPIENWVKVIETLQDFNVSILITGNGEREAMGARVLGISGHVIDLVNQLSFDQFVAVIANAQAVFCVDSVAGHIAGAYNKPTIIVTNGLSRIERWHPLGRLVSLLENKMPCSPCHNRPCEQRACITGIPSSALINQLPGLLAKSITTQ
jgi:ADP-heptose:LPS heptosyltransferase